MLHEETCIDCRPRRRNIDRIEFREEALRAAGIRRWACGQRSEHDDAAHRFLARQRGREHAAERDTEQDDAVGLMRPPRTGGSALFVARPGLEPVVRFCRPMLPP